MNGITKRGLKNAALEAELGYDFAGAEKQYARLVSDFPGTKEAESASQQLSRIAALIHEKQVYRRIHENAQKVLTTIGMNIADSKRIMEIFVSADAVDFKNRGALFIALKPDYVAQCLEMVPRTFAGDPGRNALGVGPALPFLENPGESPRQATQQEFESIIETAGIYSDVVQILGRPVMTDRTLADFECARMMDYHYSGLKIISTAKMVDQDAWSFRGREDWLDRVSLFSNLMPVPKTVDAFIRSAETRNNLLLSDAADGPAFASFGPEVLLTLIHAQALFMMVLAQTINPGIVCIHGAVPGMPDSGRISSFAQTDFQYVRSFSNPFRRLMNAAMARLNLWITGFPSAQCGGGPAFQEAETGEDISEKNRKPTPRFEGHMILQAFGMARQTGCFSPEQFVQDCMKERQIAKEPGPTRQREAHALDFPEDADAVETLRKTISQLND